VCQSRRKQPCSQLVAVSVGQRFSSDQVACHEGTAAAPAGGMAATAAPGPAVPLSAPSLDLGFLDNFPEFNEEMVPVDTFFDSYVENLEMGAREGHNYAGSPEIAIQGRAQAGEPSRACTGVSDRTSEPQPLDAQQIRLQATLLQLCAVSHLSSRLSGATMSAHRCTWGAVTRSSAACANCRIDTALAVAVMLSPAGSSRPPAAAPSSVFLLGVTGQLARMDTGDSALLPALSMPFMSSGAAAPPQENGLLHASGAPPRASGVYGITNGVPHTMAMPESSSPMPAPQMPQIPSASGPESTTRGAPGAIMQHCCSTQQCRYAWANGQQPVPELPQH